MYCLILIAEKAMSGRRDENNWERVITQPPALADDHQYPLPGSPVA